MSLVTKRIALALVVLSLSMTGVYVANTPVSANNVSDHYKFYSLSSTHPAITDPIQIFDQFSQISTDFPYVLNSLGLPTEKDGSSIVDPLLHYSLYLFLGQGTSVNENIVATHQFGDVALSLGRLVGLMTPAQKNIPPPFQVPPANHYLCYKAFGPTLSKPVTLNTQFSFEQLSLLDPTLFCNPAEKHHNGVTYPIVDPNKHLTCYSTNTPGFVSVGATILDQFAFTLGSFGIAEILCLPSTKNIPVPTEGSTWGRVKTIYR